MFSLIEENGPETALYGYLVEHGLTPGEAEAALYDMRMKTHGITIRQAATAAGNSRQTMANKIQAAREKIKSLEIANCRDCLNYDKCEICKYPELLAVICQNYKP